MRFLAISRAVVAVSPLFLSEMHSEGNDSSTPIQNNVQFPSLLVLQLSSERNDESYYGKGLDYEY